MKIFMTPTAQTIETASIPSLDRERGYFASATVTNPMHEIVAFCNNKQSIERVLTNLPAKIENFLSLRLESCEAEVGGHRIIWKNEGRSAGKLIFLLQDAPQNKGTVITAEAVFKSIYFRDDVPVTLMTIFLKRMKQQLME